MSKLKRFYSLNILKVTYYLFLVCLTVLLFNLFFPYKVVTFDKFESTKEVYTVGEPVCVDMEFDKHRDFKGSLRWLLIDGVPYVLPAGVVNRGVGADTAVRCFIADVPAGEYRIRLEAEYTLLAGLRRILVSQETNKFIIE